MSENTLIPLPTLLSHALTAFTIEFDNEFERSVLEPSGQTYQQWMGQRGARRYLLSLGGWAQHIRFLNEALTVEEFASLGRLSPARAKSTLFSLSRWGYVSVNPSVDLRNKSPAPDSVVALTDAGRRCWTLWEPLSEVIAQRWRTRFGENVVANARDALFEVTRQVDPQLPDFLPIVISRHKTMPFCAELTPPLGAFAANAKPSAESLPTYALLARVLLVFTTDFEQSSAVSLTASANFVHPLNQVGIPVKDLPQRAGISDAAVKQGVSFLTKEALALLEPIPGARGKQLRLTDKGVDAQANYLANVASVEAHWQTRFGKAPVRQLRNALEQLVVSRKLASSPLNKGLTPPAGCWRASLPLPATLPEHPIILGRGWWPDGA